jgi:hypothetical protein
LNFIFACHFLKLKTKLLKINYDLFILPYVRHPSDKCLAYARVSYRISKEIL